MMTEPKGTVDVLASLLQYAPDDTAQVQSLKRIAARYKASYEAERRINNEMDEQTSAAIARLCDLLDVYELAAIMRPGVAKFYNDGDDWHNSARDDMLANCINARGIFWSYCERAIAAAGRHKPTVTALSSAIRMLADELCMLHN